MNELMEIPKDTKQSASEVPASINAEFRIYNYFKTHPSFFLATISALVAVVSIVLNFASFLSTNLYLAFWEVDKTIYKPSIQFVYSIAMSLSFSTISILFQGFLARTFESYLPYKEKFLLHKYFLKDAKQNIANLKQLHAKTSEIWSEIPADSSEKKNTPIEKTLNFVNNEIPEMEKAYESIKKGLLKQRIFCYILVGFSCFLMWIAMCLMLTLIFSTSTHNVSEHLSLIMLFSFAYVGFIALTTWFFRCFLGIKKSDIRDDAKDPFKIVSSLDDKLPEFPIHTLFSGSLKPLFNDANCKSFAYMGILCLLIFLFALSWTGSKTASMQKEFFIINIDNQEYALIYNNGESSILERAEINGENITIDARYQKIISSDTIEMEKHRFESVDVKRCDKERKKEQKNSQEPPQ